MKKEDLREPSNPLHEGLCACLYPRYRNVCICGPEWKWVCPRGCQRECRCRGAQWVRDE